MQVSKRIVNQSADVISSWFAKLHCSHNILIEALIASESRFIMGRGKKKLGSGLIEDKPMRTASQTKAPSPSDKPSSEPPYFADKSRMCKESADLVLVLDSGERLPVHSAHLIAQSDVLSEIIEIISAEKPGQHHNIWCKELPLPDTSHKEACDFLIALYDFHGKDTLSAERLLSIIKIAHKFAMQKIVNLCDECLSSLASYDGCSRITLWVSCNLFLKAPSNRFPLLI